MGQHVQILFFSATYTKPILTFARSVVPRAYLVTPRSTEELVLDVIFQVRMDVNKCRGGKLQVRLLSTFSFSGYCSQCVISQRIVLQVLKDIYDFMTLQQSIIFVEMKRNADSVAKMMSEGGFEVSVLHGDLEPSERDRVMDDFRAGRTKVSICLKYIAMMFDNENYILSHFRF